MNGSTSEFQVLEPDLRLRFFWLPAALITVVLCLAATVFYGEEHYLVDEIEWTAATQSQTLPVLYDHAMHWSALGKIDDPIWVRATFNSGSEDMAMPEPALRLSGPFSAQVWLNGSLIGSKGTPALAASEETPGAIDSLISLRQARPGPNELVMFMSAFHANYPVARLFQDINIEPYSSVQTRPVGRYLVAISQAGVLAALFGFFVFIARRRKDPAFGWAAGAALCMLLALLTETIRAAVNYPYPYHGLRMTLLWASITGSAVCFAVALSVRFAGQVHWRRIGLAVLAAASSFLWLVKGFDHQSLVSLAALFCIYVLVLWPRTRRGDPLARAMLAVLGVIFIFAAALPWLFLDNGLFPVSAVLFGLFGLSIMKTFSFMSDEKRFSIRVDGRQRQLSPKDVTSISAAGNYAEFSMKDGEKVLARATLTSIEKLLGAPFIRIHRSHIVNINQAAKLRVKPGSRYVLEMRYGEPLPVSRQQAPELRNALTDALERQAE